MTSFLAAPLAGLAGSTAGVAGAQSVAPAQAELSAEEARRDLRILHRAFTDLHPGLTRYRSVTQIDAAFAVADASVAAGCSRAQMVVTASRLAAAVYCGHTWVNPANQRKDVVTGVFQRADKLPLTLRWIEGRVRVTGSAAPGLVAGDELLAIDSRPMTQIRDALLPLLRADGQHAGARLKRLSQLDSGPNGGSMDRLFPLCFPPRDGRYMLTLRDANGRQRDVQVAATSTSARDQVLAPPPSAWSFRLDGDIGVLTVPTFALWQTDFKPGDFLRQTFDALRDVPFLIIDQRGNEGGEDAIGRQLLSYLVRAPVQLPGSRVESAYERVPYELARFLDTWDFDFFDRTGQVRKSPGRNWLLPDEPGPRIEPVAAPYAGRTVVLIGPQNSSAGFLLARDIQRTGAATLLGQPTGGNLRGLNGGQLAWVNLPASGVGVDIPLLASFAMDDPPDAGVLPDVAVAPRWSDAVAGIDTEMAAALALVKA
ncbi:MAG: S41 family peptidase [Pseudomonadota bacterium]|nr:S41 family peptidase [Pseudomonadota bacterium]